jgi:vacuolar-type H+-ATPase subunit I/STV1
VTTFIKAEEQNYSLYNYVNMLNSEIDMIEEQNKNIESEIKRHEELGSLNEKEKEQVRAQLQQELADLDEQTIKKEKEMRNIEKQMNIIKTHVQTMSEAFKQSHFFLSVAQHAHYDEDTVFNENNVTQYLAELEEYISLFITYMAYRQENPDAAVSSLSLEKMAVKEFDKNQLNIEAPTSQDVNLLGEDMETEDELTTDPRQLYKKFHTLWSKEN